jgi:hypothetical protein
MRPQEDRTYIAEGECFPLLAITEAQAHKTTTPQPWRAGAWHNKATEGGVTEFTLHELTLV